VGMSEKDMPLYKKSLMSSWLGAREAGSSYLALLPKE